MFRLPKHIFLRLTFSLHSSLQGSSESEETSFLARNKSDAQNKQYWRATRHVSLKFQSQKVIIWVIKFIADDLPSFTIAQMNHFQTTPWSQTKLRYPKNILLCIFEKITIYLCQWAKYHFLHSISCEIFSVLPLILLPVTVTKWTRTLSILTDTVFNKCGYLQCYCSLVKSIQYISTIIVRK